MLPASASFHRLNEGAGEALTLVVTRMAQVPLRGDTTGAHALLSQICTNASLSPFTGSAAFVASTWIAPSAVQTMPESTPRAAPTVMAVGLTISTVTASGPSYHKSIQTSSLSAPLLGVYDREKVLLVDAPTKGSDDSQCMGRALRSRPPEFPAAIAIAAPRVPGPTAASIVISSGSLPSCAPMSVPRLMFPTQGLPAAAAVSATNWTAAVRSQAPQKAPLLSNTRTTRRSASGATPANVPAATPLPVSRPLPAAVPVTCVPWP